MSNLHSIVLVKRIKTGGEQQSVQNYLDQDYTIDSVKKIQEFEDGTIAVRIRLCYDPIVLDYSK